MTTLVTGATGFIGAFLCRRLLADGTMVRGTLLPDEPARQLPSGVEPVRVDPLGPDTEWQQALAGVDTVIHLAARVHVMTDPLADPLPEYLRVNCEGSERLAREAAKAGVRRLVFVSTVKVNGEGGVEPYNEASTPRPSDPYGISKWEAEQRLRRVEAETGLELVVLRPALVYGPGVRANFLALMKMVRAGVPLPLASVRNRRSLIYVENLADALARCASHPEAAGKTFLLSDGNDLSTPELVRATARALGTSPVLLPLPVPLLGLAGVLTGRGRALDRLLGSLTVDSSRIRRELDWQPPFSLTQGLQFTADWFLTEGCRL